MEHGGPDMRYGGLSGPGDDAVDQGYYEESH
jgi:hypothetical protein